MGNAQNRRYIEERDVKQYVGSGLIDVAKLPAKHISKMHLKPATLAVLVQSAALIIVLGLSWIVQLLAAAYPVSYTHLCSSTI